MQKKLSFYHVIWVYANYGGSLLLGNSAFSLGTIYSMHMVINISLDVLIGTFI